MLKKILQGALIVVLLYAASGCAVAKQTARFVGEGVKLVGVACSETAKAFNHAADSITEPEK